MAGLRNLIIMFWTSFSPFHFFLFFFNSLILRGVETTTNRIINKCNVVCLCVCFLPIHSGHDVRLTYQPGSHRRKVTQGFSSTFFLLRCVP